LNSRVAVALLREFSPHVAGGQLDLEHKYVRHVPMPNLATLLPADPALQLIASEISGRFGEALPDLEARDRFAAAAFGTSPSDWPVVGSDPMHA